MNKTHVKICGIRTLEAAQVAVEHGADFLGFNFVPESKRFIDKQTARYIIEAVKNKVSIVGVFKNASKDEVNLVADYLNLDYIQLHGDESEEYIDRMIRPVIKATSPVSLPTNRESRIQYFLLDRPTQGQGDMVDTNQARLLAEQFPLFYAGGLTPKNVSTIIEQVKPFGVDVAGGIETAGREDIAKIREFIRNVKQQYYENK